MSIYGYHRTSTKEQHLDRGIAEIENFCISRSMKLEKIYTDKQTGKNFIRPRYTVLVDDVLRDGDTLVISELDRLGRNKNGILDELRKLTNTGVRVMILEIPTTLMELSTMDNNLAKMMLETINNMLLEMYANLAQAEIQKKEKRQREGIQAKKERGEWNDYGRPKIIELDVFEKEYQRVIDGKIKPFELMKELGLTKPTYYRYKNGLKSK